MFLYQEIAQKIKEVIQGIEPSDRLADERTLSEEFNVSRSTVRKALAQLKSEGHLDIKQGSGIYVKNKMLLQDERSGFYCITEDDRSIAANIESTLLSAVIIDTPKRSEFALFTDEKLIKLERVKSFDGIKSVHAINYLPCSRFPSLELIVKNNLPLYKILTNLYQVKFGLCEETLSAGIITERTSELLEVDQMTCTINIVRHTFEGDSLIEVSEAAILSDSFQWKYSLDNINKF